MSTDVRIARLRDANPAAAELALACALAARVEPDLLRRLRLLVPHADASAEADLWFSDLLAGRDATAIALDPVVAEPLRRELRNPDSAALREAAAVEINQRHAGAHWSVRLEERIHYLDVAGGAGAEEEIDDLLLAAVDQLRVEPDPRGIARWLLGAAGRLPRAVSARLPARASAAAAALHLDRQAPPAGLLHAGESHAWLPWVAQSLPQVTVPVQLVDGAVILGTDGPDSVLLSDVPDTDPLVIEVRWNDGVRAVSQRVRFRFGEPVQVETGTRRVALVTLTGASYDLAADGEPEPAGLNFDHRKAALRPCLAREDELRELLDELTRDPAPAWVGIMGRPGCGASTLLVAATDALRAEGTAIVEHFFGSHAGADDPRGVRRSCLAQLTAYYPDECAAVFEGLTDAEPELGSVLDELAERGAFGRRPLVIALDGVDVDANDRSVLWRLPLPDMPPRGVHYLVTTSSWRETREYIDRRPLRLVHLDRRADRQVCLAMIKRDHLVLDPVFDGHPDANELADLADDLPSYLARILTWAKRQPARSVTAATIPATLTTRWPSVRADLVQQFGEPNVDFFLDVLRAADGRHIWQDCASTVATMRGTGYPDWPRFWRSCVTMRIVNDAGPDGIVRLAEPSTAPMLADGAQSGDHLLGLRDETPPEFARTASPTRLAAAVAHALATGETADAHRLCSDLAVLRRRYTEDVQGLLDDLAAVADALDHDESFALTSGGSEPRPLAPDVHALRTVVQHIAKDGLPPAAFATALYDRLAGRGALGAVPGLSRDRAALAPLRVRTVLAEEDLSSSTHIHDIPGPTLALTTLDERATGAALPVMADGPWRITPSGVRSLDGRWVSPRWSLVGAVRGQSGGFVAWSGGELYADLRRSSEPGAPWPSARPDWLATFSGHLDIAARLPDVIAMAEPDGTTTIFELVEDGSRQWRLAGHGSRVTAFAARPVPGRPWEILSASEDGLIRMLAEPQSVPRIFAGHRGAVRCLAAVGPITFVSGGDDGCVLEWRYDDPKHPVARRQGQAAVTCLAVLPDGAVLLGSVDGLVEIWTPRSGESTVLGSHVNGVRGVSALSDSLVVSWANSVLFWNVRGDRPLTGIAFRDGVRDVLVGEKTYTVLCGDGSVQRRPRPRVDIPNDAARGSLAVLHGDVYAGLGDDLLRLPGGETSQRRIERLRLVPPDAYHFEPFTQAAALSAGVVARNSAGRVVAFTPQGDWSTAGLGDLVATDGSTAMVTATGRRVMCHLDRDTARSAVAPAFGTSELVVNVEAPAEVTSVACAQGGVAVAGLASGDTWVVGGSLDHPRVTTLTGNGDPVTAVAALPDGARVTGTSAGDIRFWPADPAHGPTHFPRRAGAVTAMATAGPWLVTAGQDGAIVLWATDPPRPVHEVWLGAPIVALDAEPGLVAARSAHGRLWLLDLDEPPDYPPLAQRLTVGLTARKGQLPAELRVRLDDPSSDPYELTAVRTWLDDQLVRTAVVGHWPQLESDGTLTVPARPLPDHPLLIRFVPPVTRVRTARVEIDLASRLIPGYRSTVTLQIAPPFR